MIPGKPNKVKDIIERQKAELVAIAQELATVKADRDSLRVANEDLRDRAVRAENSLRLVHEALNEVAT